jgi:hypothetical protein
MARTTSVAADVQPCSLARTRPNVAAAEAMVKAAPPPQSMRGRSARRVSASERRATKIVTRPMGTLTKNTQRHERVWVSRPPTIGPAAAAAPLVAPQIPNGVS